MHNANPPKALVLNGIRGDCLASYMGTYFITDLVHSVILSCFIAALLHRRCKVQIRSELKPWAPGGVSHKLNWGKFLCRNQLYFLVLLQFCGAEVTKCKSERSSAFKLTFGRLWGCLTSQIGADSDTDLVHSAMFSGSVARLVAQDVRSANPNKGPASNGPLEGSGEISHKPDGGRFEY